MSDVADTVHGREVHDVLADLPISYADQNPDWDAYERQKNTFASGETVDKSSEGWRLDRFKFLPMIEKAHEHNPDAEWYVFVETDTYHFWDTIFRVLSQLDSRERHYLGTSVAGADNVWFAYGGAGFVLSRGLLNDLPLSGDRRLSVKYESLVKGDCCGDAVLAYVLYRELRIRIGNMYPVFLGDPPQHIAVSAQSWCTPLAALHRVSPAQMAELWHWERCRAYTERPITFATFLDFGVSSILDSTTPSKLYWDNGADIEQEPGSLAHKSASACFAACEYSDRCLQASYSNQVCNFGEAARLGNSVNHDIESGWDLKKLTRLGWQPAAPNGTTCEHVIWPTPVIMQP